MFARQLLAFSSASLLILQAVFGQGAAPAQSVERSNVASTPTPAASLAQPQISFDSVHVDGPYIALTFDDGPHATLTPKLLDLLAAHQMRATFFVVGQNAAGFDRARTRYSCPDDRGDAGDIRSVGSEGL